MNLKKQAALKALDYVKDGQILGLGTGSTVAYFIEGLGKKIEDESIRIIGVATSYQSQNLAKKYNIPLKNLEDVPYIDLDVDGADEVDSELNVIKGGGAALLKEKIVASASKEVIIIVDGTKMSNKLGEKFALPIEVIPFAYKLIMEKIKTLGAKVKLREAEKKDGPIVTDNGNFILDAKFESIRDPKNLEKELNLVPGILECGIFYNLVDKVIVAKKEGTEVLEK